MTDSEFFEDIKMAIHKQFDIPEDNIEEESFFDEDLHISELDMEDFISSIQSKYDIVIDNNQIADFKQISDLVTYLYEKLSQSA